MNNRVSFLKQYFLEHSALKWLWILSLVICISSWVHFYTAKTIRVDYSSIEPISLRIIVSILIAWIWTKFCYVLYKTIVNGKLDFSIAPLRFNIYLNLGIQFLTLPLLSNDIFSVLAYSQAHIQGQDIYRNFNGLLTDFAAYIHPNYATTPCMYGPLSVLEICIPFILKVESVFGALAYSKLLFLVHAILYVEVSIRIIKSLATPYAYLILLYPLWMIQGLGQMHNDILGMTFLILAILCMIRFHWILCAVFLSLAMLCKLTFILFTALPILYMYSRGELQLKAFVSFVVSLALSLLIIGNLLFYPFSMSVLSILEPLRSMDSLRPSSTFSDIVAHVLLVFNSDFETNASYAKVIFKYVGLFSLLYLGLLFCIKEKKEDTWIRLLLLIFTIVIFVISHRFLPWYLMSFSLLIVFFKQDIAWVKWLILVTWVSFFQDLAILLNTDFILGQILMLIATVFTILTFFFQFKERYRIYD